MNAEINHTAQQLQNGHITPRDVEAIIRAYQEEAQRLEGTLDFDPLCRALEAIIERHVGFLPQDRGRRGDSSASL